MLLPVFSDMVASGLKPAFIIWSKSCPISFPVADICENASTSELKRSRSPMEMSPICFSVGMTFSASMLNPSIVCAPPARSLSISGVFTAYSRNSPKNCVALSLLPNNVSNEILRFSTSWRTSIIVFTNSTAFCAVNTPPMVMPTRFKDSSSKLALVWASNMPWLRFPFINNSTSTAFMSFLQSCLKTLQDLLRGPLPIHFTRRPRIRLALHLHIPRGIGKHQHQSLPVHTPQHIVHAPACRLSHLPKHTEEAM